MKHQVLKIQINWQELFDCFALHKPELKMLVSTKLPRCISPSDRIFVGQPHDTRFILFMDIQKSKNFELQNKTLT